MAPTILRMRHNTHSNMEIERSVATRAGTNNGSSQVGRAMAEARRPTTAALLRTSSSMKQFALFFRRPMVLALVCCVLLSLIGGSAAQGTTSTYSSSWDSSPFNLGSVSDNNLGLACKACSEAFCHAGVNGLDLWISLEEVCESSHQPYFEALPGDGSIFGRTAVMEVWSPVVAGAVCAIVGTASLVMGYRYGSEIAMKRHKSEGFNRPV